MKWIGIGLIMFSVGFIATSPAWPLIAMHVICIAINSVCIYVHIRGKK